MKSRESYCLSRRYCLSIQNASILCSFLERKKLCLPWPLDSMGALLLFAAAAAAAAVAVAVAVVVAVVVVVVAAAVGDIPSTRGWST